MFSMNVCMYMHVMYICNVYMYDWMIIHLYVMYAQNMYACINKHEWMNIWMNIWMCITMKVTKHGKVYKEPNGIMLQIWINIGMWFRAGKCTNLLANIQI